jgi:hypothetical protein
MAVNMFMMHCQLHRIYSINGNIIVKNELGRIRHEAFMACVFPGLHMFIGTEETQ